MAKAGGKFLARQAIKRFGRRSSKWVIPKGPGAQGVNPVVVEDDIVRVRHHTSPQSLKTIKSDGAIRPGGHGSPQNGWGVDVEVAPFGKYRTASSRLGSRRGAYIEFDARLSELSNISGTGLATHGNSNVARIVTGKTPAAAMSNLVQLAGRNAQFKDWSKWWNIF